MAVKFLTEQYNSEAVTPINAAQRSVLVANDIKMIHFYAFGKEFDIIHNLSENYYSKLSSEIDYLYEIAIELGYEPCNHSKCLESEKYEVLESKRYDYNSAISSMIEKLSFYLETLKGLSNYDEISDDIRSNLDDMIRFWSKEIDYKLLRRK